MPHVTEPGPIDAPPGDEAEPEKTVVVSSPSEPPPAEAPAIPVLVPGANISMESVEADGQRLIALTCRADKLPLFGSLAVVASIAKQKKALDRCAPKGGAVALTWSFHKNRSRDVTVVGASSSRAGTCVAKAMRKVMAPFNAQCGVVMLVGNAAGADEALAGLRETMER